MAMFGNSLLRPGAAGAVNLLCVRLTDAAWSRIFTELEAAQLHQVFAQNRRTVDELADT